MQVPGDNPSGSVPPPADQEDLPIDAGRRRARSRFGLLLAALILGGLLWAALTYLRPGQEPLQEDPPRTSAASAARPRAV